MALRLRTNQQINRFIQKVISEAQHHAPQVQNIIAPLSQEVLKRLNLTSDRVEVYERNGQMARTCWVTLNGKRYAFSYNYDDGKIDLRERSLQGNTLYQFSNQTTLPQIRRAISRL